jgi:hypothetical protein
VGDIAGAVLADSVTGASFVAFCVAIVDSVSCCGYSRGGVSFVSQGHPLFTREITWPSLTYNPSTLLRTGGQRTVKNIKPCK